MAEVGYLFACRSLRFPMWKLGLFTNKWVWLGSGAMLLAQLGVVGRRLWRGGPRVRAGRGQEVFQRIA
jgi:hypothetical protein